MDRLDETFTGERHSLGTYVGAAVFVAGLVLVGIGALSVLLDALAGTVPSGIALAGAGAAVTTVLLLAILVLHDRPMESRVRAGLTGSALAVVLVVPSWAASPSVLATAGLFVAGLLYLVGTLTLTGVVFEGAIATDVTTGSYHTSYVRDSRGSGPTAGVADGGSDDDDLEFLLDEGDRD